jgi:threonine aldolase
LHLADSRLVVHLQTSEAAIDDFLVLLEQLSEEKKAAMPAKIPKELNSKQ